MFIHLGDDKLITDKGVIGIFDIDTYAGRLVRENRPPFLL